MNGTGCAKMRVRERLPQLPSLPNPRGRPSARSAFTRVRISRIRLSPRLVLPDGSSQLTLGVEFLEVTWAQQTQVAKKGVGNPLVPPAASHPPHYRGTDPLTQETVENPQRYLVSAPYPFEVPVPTPHKPVETANDRL